MPRSGVYALIGAIVVISGLGVVFGLRPSDSPSDKVHVVASSNVWGSLVSQIGGDHVLVTSILTDPSVDPHLFESSAQTAALVAQADVVIANGLGYDDFLVKLLAASPNPDRTVVTAAEVFGVTDPTANPHLWYDIPKAPLMIAAIGRAIADRDPTHAATFAANAQQLSAELQPIETVLAEINRDFPGAPVADTEPVADYLLKAAGLVLKTPGTFARAIESGDEPSPQDQQTLIDLVRSRSVKVLLYNSQAITPVTEQLKDVASQAGVPIVPITETIPPTEPTYQSWQLHQSQAIRAALLQGLQ